MRCFPPHQGGHAVSIPGLRLRHGHLPSEQGGFGWHGASRRARQKRS